MRKQTINIVKRVICNVLLVCMSVQIFGLDLVHASSGRKVGGEKVGSRLSCSPSGVSAEVLVDNLTSLEAKRLIDMIFVSLSDRDQIIAKAQRSPAHKNLLRIGFETCINFERTPEDFRPPLMRWERDAVCKLIRLFWNSNSIRDVPEERYSDNSIVKCLEAGFFKDGEELRTDIADRYLCQAIIRLRYFDALDSPDSIQPRVILGIGEFGRGRYATDKRKLCEINNKFTFCSCVLVAIFGKGRCGHLAECIWSLMSESCGFFAEGMVHCDDSSEKCSLNDADFLIEKTTNKETDFSACMDFLRIHDEGFKSLTRSDLLCPPEYIEQLEKRAILRRTEEYEEEEKKRLLEARKKEKMEAMAKRKEEEREKERKRQERRCQRRAEEEERRRVEAEAKRKEEEDRKRRDEEEAQHKEEEDRRRREQEEAKRNAEREKIREEEARIKAEHDESGVTKVIEANVAIRESHANEPNHDSNGRISFAPSSRRK